MIRVSIIIPVYYGKRYLKNLIDQAERTARHLHGTDQAELLFVNDAPDDPLDEAQYSSDFLTVTVYNTAVHRGIHGARAEGLSRANGEYILFLDQDDLIKEAFLADQLEKIGTADAIVCRLINDKKLQYTDSYRFEEVITKDFLMTNWNPIVSPGQVLLRRSAIPDLWKENIMEHNGADDYLLWLAMFAEEKKFVLNQNVLFERIVSDSNTSANTNQMMDSEAEMIRILSESKLFSKEEKDCLHRLSDSLRREHVRELDTYRNAYRVYGRWIRRVLDGSGPAELLKKKGIRKIAIYGAGYIGKSILQLLENSGIEVFYFLDRNAAYIDTEIPVYTVSDAPMQIDGIIISLFGETDQIRELLSSRFGCPVYTIGELL